YWPRPWAMSNYAQAGVGISLRYTYGAFVAQVDPRSSDYLWTLDRRKKAEDAFLAGLEELEAKRLRSNIHKGQANFAPKQIKERPRRQATSPRTKWRLR